MDTGRRKSSLPWEASSDIRNVGFRVTLREFPMQWPGGHLSRIQETYKSSKPTPKVQLHQLWVYRHAPLETQKTTNSTFSNWHLKDELQVDLKAFQDGTKPFQDLRMHRTGKTTLFLQAFDWASVWKPPEGASLLALPCQLGAAPQSGFEDLCDPMVSCGRPRTNSPCPRTL